MSCIKINDPKVVDFYKNHPHIDVNVVNALIIELLGRFDYTSIALEPLSETIINSKLNDINVATSKLLSDIEMKLEHDKSADKSHIIEAFEANSIALKHELVDMINKIVPGDNHHYAQIKGTMQDFYTSISSDMQRLENASSSAQIKDIMGSFEMKTTLMIQNIQQPIYSFISASEDRINKNISTLRSTGFENPETYSKLVADIQSMITPSDRTVTSASDDKHLTSILSKTFTSADISSKKMGMHNNTIFLKRIGHQAIIVQNYDIDHNVRSEDVNNCRTMISDENVCGVVLSQNSGISGKNNYQIEMHNNNVIVFVHNAEYSSDKIQVAVSIIDNLYNQMRNFAKSNTNTEFTIPKDLLENINNEYQLFISQKAAVVDVFKDSQKRVLAQLDEIRFPCLDKYLSTKYSAPIVKSGLKCDLCKSYNANNLKALAAHKRGCMRKHGKLNVNNTSSERNHICITPISFEKEKGGV